MKRTYENALRLLESRRRKARPKDVRVATALTDTAISPSNSALRGVPSLVGMREWLQILGHSDEDINELNIIHVAGTKGKGSTCAFTRSFLLAHRSRTGFPQRVGLYTSPDLRYIRERIQIDDKPIIEDLFTKYFFEVWERLSPSNSDLGTGIERPPRYLQLLALVAFHAFIRENVRAAIFETHHGGEFDATNVIQGPVVTAITSLGMDHVAQLGPTIEDIAWHKAGIFKPGAPAFSAFQEPGPAAVLRKRAIEKGIELTFVPTLTSLPTTAKALGVSVQKANCSLALALTNAFLQRTSPGNDMSADDVYQGVTNFSWPGRFEALEDGNSMWYLDGAHNGLSVKQAAKWFAQNVNISKERRSRILIFSHYSEERDGKDLLEDLAHALLENDVRPDHVIFTTYQEREDGSTRLDKTLKSPENPFPDFLVVYSELWKKFDPQAEVSKHSTIEGALMLAKRIGDQEGGMQALVTGSLHLVGGALNILRP